MTALERLREGYVRGLIDLETFEHFVGLLLEGGPVMLPVEVASLGPAGPPSTANFARVVKEVWSDYGSYQVLPHSGAAARERHLVGLQARVEEMAAKYPGLLVDEEARGKKM